MSTATKKFDKNKNLIYFRNSVGWEFWQEFDENHNVIYYKSPAGEEEWYKYNEDNKKIKISKKEYKKIYKEKKK